MIDRQQATETRFVSTTASSVDVYEALDAGVLLEPLDRGWPYEVVGVDPVNSLRLEHGETEPWRSIESWLPETIEAETAAGAYGYLGYDVCRHTEELPDLTRRDTDLPLAALDLYDTVVVFHDEGAIVEAIGHPGENRPAEERAESLAERIGGVEPLDREPDVTAKYRGSNFTEETYREAVEKVKDEIREGETFQANISQRYRFTSDADAIDVYRALRRSNPAPYMGLWSDGDHALISSSPELLLEKEDDVLRTRPIAGTRPRGAGEDEDTAYRRDLEASEKERAEHSILVDLERNDLGKVAEHGTVEVTEFMETVPYPSVHHLESTVEARADVDSAVSALEAVFPGGTVTGAPKPRTLEIIEDVEPTRRGPYTGSMGYLSWNGDAVFNILIRTFVKERRSLYLQVGGGVVHDSDPEREYQETLHKAKAAAEALAADVDELGRGTADSVDEGEEDGGIVQQG